MLRIDSDLKVILFPGATDFRLGINGLKLKVLSNYADKELTDILFVFCSKDKRQLKILEFDATGVWLYQKRLNKCRFEYPQGTEKIDISGVEFKALFDVINIMIRGQNVGVNISYSY